MINYIYKLAHLLCIGFVFTQQSFGQSLPRCELSNYYLSPDGAEVAEWKRHKDSVAESASLTLLSTRCLVLGNNCTPRASNATETAQEISEDYNIVWMKDASNRTHVFLVPKNLNSLGVWASGNEGLKGNIVDFPSLFDAFSSDWQHNGYLVSKSESPSREDIAKTLLGFGRDLIAYALETKASGVEHAADELIFYYYGHRRQGAQAVNSLSDQRSVRLYGQDEWHGLPVAFSKKTEQSTLFVDSFNGETGWALLGDDFVYAKGSKAAELKEQLSPGPEEARLGYKPVISKSDGAVLGYHSLRQLNLQAGNSALQFFVNEELKKRPGAILASFQITGDQDVGLLELNYLTNRKEWLFIDADGLITDLPCAPSVQKLDDFSVKPFVVDDKHFLQAVRLDVLDEKGTVLFFRGGPRGSIGQSITNQPGLIYYLRKGYDVIAFDVSGSDDVLNVTNSRLYTNNNEALAEDAQSILRYLQSHNELRNQNIILHGSSFGALTALGLQSHGILNLVGAIYSVPWILWQDSNERTDGGVQLRDDQRERLDYEAKLYFGFEPNGPNRWAEWMDSLRHKAALNWPDIPVVVSLAGDDDRIDNGRTINFFCTQNAKVLVTKGAKHRPNSLDVLGMRSTIFDSLRDIENIGSDKNGIANDTCPIVRNNPLNLPDEFFSKLKGTN